MDRGAFVQALGHIFEHSPWVAERAWDARPFQTVAQLHRAMTQVVKDAPREKQLALLNAHPDLAGREAQEGTMTDASVAEQAGAGLNALTKEEMAKITRLNTEYKAKHGFPFIACVRHYTKAGILYEFERRAANDTEPELKTGLEQIFAITRLRLDSLFGES
ncbi:MAG TPA: 2-oxo-4-hydroxy-4-carboxy-5-ureidoimidazoline decarboxylase [Burkholderiales bacterium]|nr:2-oxo-4-hydroxy-4-carboxy-5-ureidoimidazoline decarboxylase [Burkholderiales bacterium]